MSAVGPEADRQPLIGADFSALFLFFLRVFQQTGISKLSSRCRATIFRRFTQLRDAKRL